MWSWTFSGSRSSRLLDGAAGINAISDYRRQSRDKTSKDKETPKKQDDKENHNVEELPCNYCGYFGHGANPKTQIRNTKCPAFGKACSKCGELGHFGKVCQQKGKSAKAEQVYCEDEFSDSDSVKLFAVTAGTGRQKVRHNNSSSLYSLDSKGRAQVRHITTDKSGKWINSSPESQPSVAVTISVSDSSYYQTALKELKEALQGSGFTLNY